MGNYNFRKDIQVGEAGERIVMRDLELQGYRFISDNKDNKYDLVVEQDGNKSTIEVKTDEYCIPPKEIKLPSGAKVTVEGRDNGNLFVEFECRGKASGIDVTQAEWFITYFKHLNQIWYIKTEELRELIKKENLKIFEKSGDAGSNTKGYEIPRDKYKNYFMIREVPVEWKNQN
jgi:hypothetical protein